MDLTAASAGQALADVPIGTMITNLGVGIAEAQRALDRHSIRTARSMKWETLRIDGAEKSLLELGFTPTFYQFTEATIEMSVSITMRVEEETSVGLELGASGSFDASSGGRGAAGAGASSGTASGSGGTGTSAAAAGSTGSETTTGTKKCAGETKSGDPCKNNAKEGSEFCGVHG